MRRFVLVVALLAMTAACTEPEPAQLSGAELSDSVVLKTTIANATPSEEGTRGYGDLQYRHAEARRTHAIAPDIDPLTAFTEFLTAATGPDVAWNDVTCSTRAGVIFMGGSELVDRVATGLEVILHPEVPDIVVSVSAGPGDLTYDSLRPREFKVYGECDPDTIARIKVAIGIPPAPPTTLT